MLDKIAECMTLIIVWYQGVCDCSQYCFGLVRPHQCSSVQRISLVPHIHLLNITFFKLYMYISITHIGILKSIHGGINLWMA